MRSTVSSVTPRRKKAVDRPVVLKDPAAIKALAHPARLAVLDELFAGRELTATECAELAGVSPSAMSYHMRALERAGIVERAESSDGRERPWRAAGSRIDVRSADSRLAAAASITLATSVIDRLSRQLGEWLARSDRDDPRWRATAGITNARLWLDINEAEALARDVQAVLDKYRGRTDAARPATARQVRVGFVLFPSDEHG
jgi:DNA-binding transcriptional ArsR family regulator